MIPLLTTKLFIPPRRPRDSVVDRSRPTDRLDTTNGQRLTLVSAPAGFGKTALLSEWIPHSEYCVPWLSLDANDPCGSPFGYGLLKQSDAAIPAATEFDANLRHGDQLYIVYLQLQQVGDRWRIISLDGFDQHITWDKGDTP